jgi:hypothetical protein
MSNNFTPEQIVMICIGLFFGGLMVYIGIDSIYKRGYQNGYAKGYVRGKLVQSERLID